MAAYLETEYAALRALIAATWTDVPADGIWEAEHADMIPWADLTLPFAVIVIAEGRGAEWGMTNLAYELPVEIYWVGATTGSGSPQRAKAEALRDALYRTGLSDGQVVDVPEISWSAKLPPNEAFAAKNYTQRASRVIATVLVGETYA